MNRQKLQTGLGVIPASPQGNGSAIKAARFGTEVPSDPSSEVVGHCIEAEMVICPHCGGVNRIMANHNEVLTYECAYCSDTFNY